MVHPSYLHQTIGGGCECCKFDDKYVLHSLYGEMFENNVKLNCLDLFPEDDHGFNIWGYSCINGTLCLICRSEENIVLWNLATKEFKVVSASPRDFAPHWEVLADAHRFGYDPISDDYKVTRQIDFSSKTNRDIDQMSWEEAVDIWQHIWLIIC